MIFTFLRFLTGRNMKNTKNIFLRLGLSVFSAIQATLMIMVVLSFTGKSAIAAPVIPDSDVKIAGTTITSTKTATPTSTVVPGQILTYTIVFTSDTQVGTVVITDSLSDMISFAGTITGTPIASVTTAILDETLVWTVTEVTTDSLVSLMFSAQVSSLATNGHIITNTAYISDSASIVATNPVTHRVTVSYATFLPLITKPALAQLTIESINTGDFTFEVWNLSESIKVISCSVKNNSTTHCGDFAVGTYVVKAVGTQCGTSKATITFSEGPRTLRVSCP
jgi:hypothetical protein